MSGNQDNKETRDEGKSKITEASFKAQEASHSLVAPTGSPGNHFDFSALQGLVNDPAMYQGSCLRAGILLESFANLAGLEQLKEKMARIKEDPSLKLILNEIKSGGPSAMMKYWNNPNVLQKLGQAMAVNGTESSYAQGLKEADENEDDRILHRVVLVGNEKALKEALAAGADKDEQDAKGRTALHFACGLGKVKCAKILLEAGASINMLDMYRNTILHYAASYGHVECVKLLIKCGATVNPRNQFGQTPIDVAKQKKQNHVLKFLGKDGSSDLCAFIICAIPLSVFLFLAIIS